MAAPVQERHEKAKTNEDHDCRKGREGELNVGDGNSASPCVCRALFSPESTRVAYPKV